MKLKKIILSGLVMVASLSANAQEAPKTEYVFNPHWYVQAQVGGQYTLGEIGFGDLLSPNIQLGGGYNLNPVVGFRFSVNAWQSKAGWEATNGTTYDWKWNYIAPNVDATFNLTNLFCDYNPERLLNVGVFAGVGLNVAFGNDEAHDANTALTALHKYTNYQPLYYLWDGTKTRLQGRIGATADFRLNDNLSLGLELQATTLNDRFNSKRAGNSDWYFNALVGVKYAFGKTYSTRKVTPPAPVEKIIERIVEKVVDRPATNTAQFAQEEVEPLRRDIFFTISSTTITVSEMQKVKDIADYLKENADATVEITGYADKGTGNASINKRLSEKRAKAVVDALINKYGISASRIKSDSKGDTEQPYAEEILNRVSICIAK